MKFFVLFISSVMLISNCSMIVVRLVGRLMCDRNIVCGVLVLCLVLMSLVDVWNVIMMYIM